MLIITSRAELPELGQTDNKPVNRLTDKKHNHIRRHPTFISDVEPRDPRVRTYAPGAKGDGLPQEGTAAESKNKCTYVFASPAGAQGGIKENAPL